MNVEIKGIHVEVNKRIRDYIDLKMPRLDFGKDLLVDFLLNISREKSLFKLDTTLNFRWGASKHVSAESFDLNQGIDELYDKLCGPARELTVLATAHSEPNNKGSGEEEPMLMTIRYGKGRVFHTTLGHDVPAMKWVFFL